MTDTFSDFLETRNETIDNESYDWTCIKGDLAWKDIVQAWKISNKDAYLRYAKKFDTLVQAGGYCGLIPKLFSKYFKYVYTFEPDSLNFHCLVNNCQSKNIIKINAALGSNKSLIRMNTDIGGSNPGMKNVIDDKSKQNIIPCLKLDNFYFNSLDVLQLDVEGSEYDILCGGIENIKKHKPVVIVEDCNDRILEFLKPLGYNINEITHRDTVLTTTIKD